MKWILLITLLLCIPQPEKVQTLPSKTSCPGKFLGPPCQEFWFADAVFIGTVKEVIPVPFSTSLRPDWQEYQKLKVKLSVEEVFRGDVGSEITYEGTDCYYDFKQGETYLIYAPKVSEGRLQLSRHHTLTRPLSEAGEDLDYIRRLARAPEGGRIYGKVHNHINRPTLRINEQMYNVNFPVGGLKIVAEAAGKQFETTTDDTGGFEFVGLPEGVYRVKALVPDYLSRYVESSANLPNRGCAPISFSIQATGEIRGRVLDANGQPVSDATVSIFSAEGVIEEMLDKVKPYYMTRSTTEKNGLFGFDRLPSGRYYLAVNLVKQETKQDSVAATYPRTFYPGVVKLTDASAINLANGERKRNIEFKLPPL